MQCALHKKRIAKAKPNSAHLNDVIDLYANARVYRKSEACMKLSIANMHAKNHD